MLCFLPFVFILSSVSYGQAVTPVVRALLIANSSYAHLSAIPSALPSAERVRDALLKAAVPADRITLRTNLEDKEIRTLLEDQFIPSVQPGDVVVIYFAGQMLQSDGDNYLLGPSFDPTAPREASDAAYLVTRSFGRLQRRRAQLSLLFWEGAYRDPSLTGRAGYVGGLAEVGEDMPASIVMYGAGKTQLLELGAAKEPSVFSQVLSDLLVRPGIEMLALAAELKSIVEGRTGGKQNPYSSLNYSGRFHFLEPPKTEDPSDSLLWSVIQNSTNRLDFDRYLASFPSGKFAEQAKQRRDFLIAESAAWTKVKDAPAMENLQEFLATFKDGAYAVAAGGLLDGLMKERSEWARIQDSQDPAVYDVFIRSYPNGKFTQLAGERRAELLKAIKPTGGPPSDATPPYGTAAGEKRTNRQDGLSYVWVPAGTFDMGCTAKDPDCASDEKPPHKVEITRGIWLTSTEITVAAYRKFGRLPDAPGFNREWRDETMPVVKVTWQEAQTFCSGMNGRLPTEAEWEYAARANSTDPWAGAKDRANVARPQGALPVAKFGPNAWGLYDVVGNVAEWASDWYGKFDPNASSKDPQGPQTGVEHVIRGGSFGDDVKRSRVSARGKLEPQLRDNTVGFRCVIPALP